MYHPMLLMCKEKKEKDERWDEHFLQLCLDHARMSKDPSTRVGAVIVGPDRELVSAGFNGFPRGIRDSQERLLDRATKLKLVVHAEMNAILAAARIGTSTKGCTLYVSAISGEQIWGGAPCIRCTVELIQAGISEIVCYTPEGIPDRWIDDLTYAQNLLIEAGVKYREIPRKKV